VYPVLRAFEENGRARRGYFVETLGAAQFGTPGSVDRLRSFASPDRCPPARWCWPRPTRPTSTARRCPGPSARTAPPAEPGSDAGAAVDVGEGTGGGRRTAGHRAGRKAGALVVLVDGELVLYVERGGKTLLSWTRTSSAQGGPRRRCPGAVRGGALGRMVVQKADGASVHESTPPVGRVCRRPAIAAPRAAAPAA
jgi:ATP-dependent Lhr-like helicase